MAEPMGEELTTIPERGDNEDDLSAVLQNLRSSLTASKNGASRGQEVCLIREVLPLRTLGEIYMMALIANRKTEEEIADELKMKTEEVSDFIVRVSNAFGIAPSERIFLWHLAKRYIEEPETLTPSDEVLTEKAEALTLKAQEVMSEATTHAAKLAAEATLYMQAVGE